MSFTLKLPEKRWINVRSSYGHPLLAWSSLNAVKNNPQSAGSVQSQIFISYELWDRRRKFYPLYLEGIEAKQKSIKTTLKSQGFWDLGEFEHDVAKRLWLQTGEVLKDFIPVYKIVCHDIQAYVPQDISHYFIMMQNGRLVCRNINEDVEIKKPLVYSRNRLMNNLKALQKRLKENLTPNIYEKDFLEVHRLIEVERYNFAVIQTIVILDWFANQVIESHLISKTGESANGKSSNSKYIQMWKTEKDSKIRVNTPNKFKDYFPAIGIKLDRKLLDGLQDIYEKRNVIVHHYKINLIDEQYAKKALEIGKEIVSISMKYLISKDSNKNEQLHFSER